MAADIHLFGPFEAPLDLVVDLRRTLSQVRPCLWVLKEAVLVGALGSPYNAGRGARGVKAGVRLMAFVRLAELAVDFRGELCWGGIG